MLLDGWDRPDGDLGRYIAEESEKTLRAYGAQPNNVERDARFESDTARGGYQHRQLYELIQNSADALMVTGDDPKGARSVRATGQGRIEIRLTERCLYCADNGDPIGERGVRALMFSHMSPKRGSEQIGTFGLGFKAVMGVSDSPEFFSRSGSFQFDRKRARTRIKKVVPDAVLCPVLPLPEPIDPAERSAGDDVLRELMAWANNIVRLPLRDSEVHTDLRKKMEGFPPEFLLFVPHVKSLELEVSPQEWSRTIELRRSGDGYVLDVAGATTGWKLFEHSHPLSANAQSDRREGDGRDEVPIWWAVPTDRLDRSKQAFWAYFPTSTPSLVPGILNAPWKTNEDRQNLLQGLYNDELITAAAEMIADALPELATSDDPARHLDALPRRFESDDKYHAENLRSRLFRTLGDRKIIPDQDGNLQLATELHYPPLALIKEMKESKPALDQWASLPQRPVDWLHHDALSANRWAKINRLLPHKTTHASLAEWLEVLVDTDNKEVQASLVDASIAALRILSLIPENMRDGPLGRIVLTAAGDLRSPNTKRLFLPDNANVIKEGDQSIFVNSDLVTDPAILALLESLGVSERSPYNYFQDLVGQLSLDSGSISNEVQFHAGFWKASRELRPSEAFEIIEQVDKWQNRMRVRTLTGDWKPLYSVLMPGEILSNDGSHDQGATIDIEFHKRDQELLSALGVADSPSENCNFVLDLKLLRPSRNSYRRSSDSKRVLENDFLRYQKEHEKEYRERPDLKRKPQQGMVAMDADDDIGKGVGPLDVLHDLSEEGRVRYTEALLKIDACFQPWEMGHQGANWKEYPQVKCQPFPIYLLREYGRIRTPDGIVPLSDALGSPPKNPSALDALLRHPKADKIKRAFDLAEPEVASEEQAEAEVKACRADVRRCSSDAERLLVAVGEDALFAGLPELLLDAVEDEDGSLTGIAVADAAIAIYHTDALRQFKENLVHLNPPKRWAGSAGALAFVRSLGFSDEWAGQRGNRRPPFEEVDGPRSLPELHGYQRTVADNLREMLRSARADSAGRRGMISMPTGSGKTRVAVQAIVESMRDDGFRGGVLWVADRDELCEQAVQAWEQVWRSEGIEANRLRISRLWQGQDKPLPASDRHVIVASIQTLRSVVPIEVVYAR